MYMINNIIQIQFLGLKPTQPIKKYILEKIEKHKHLYKEATSIEVYVKENVNRRGVDSDFRIDINVVLPKSTVRVEVVGSNMYANIDQASDIMARRLKRYNDRKKYWEGSIPWRVLEADVLNEDLKEQDDEFSLYIPKIAVRKKVEDMSPMEEAEAIERMELWGYNQLLFRNKATGKISMVYRREKGDYGLVEPTDTELE